MKYGFWERFYKIEKWCDNQWRTVPASRATSKFDRLEEAEKFINKLLNENPKERYKILEFTIYDIPFKEGDR